LTFNRAFAFVLAPALIVLSLLGLAQDCRFGATGIGAPVIGLPVNGLNAFGLNAALGAPTPFNTPAAGNFGKLDRVPGNFVPGIIGLNIFLVAMLINPYEFGILSLSQDDFSSTKRQTLRGRLLFCYDPFAIKI